MKAGRSVLPRPEYSFRVACFCRSGTSCQFFPGAGDERAVHSHILLLSGVPDIVPVDRGSVVAMQSGVISQVTSQKLERPTGWQNPATRGP